MTTANAQLQSIYPVVFFSAVLVFASLEALWPRLALVASVRTRWLGNIGTNIIGTAFMTALLPLSGIAFAHFVEERGWGALNTLELPALVSVVLTILLLDLARYGIHLMMHSTPFLWRLHRLHHTDQDMDFSTELRVHPFELLVGAALSFAFIIVVGPPVLGLLLFATVFAVQAFWTHSNVRFPAAVDRVVRLVFTTPEVHRIHHSVDLRESNSNFGAMFTFWDRIFGTFVEQPALGHEQMVLGVAEFRDHKHMSLPWMLVDPFLNGEDASATSERPLPADAPAVR